MRIRRRSTELWNTTGQDVTLPSCKGVTSLRCSGADGAGVMEDCFWDALEIVRDQIEKRRPMVQFLADRLAAARDGGDTPDALKLKPGTVTTLRNELGRAVNYCNVASGGAVFVAAADLLGSTSMNKIADGFPAGYWNAATNVEARALSIGGICEDGIAGACSGLSSYGRHIGVGASYAAFLAPLGHIIAARLRAIGNHARVAVSGGSYRPMILVCAHAGLTTGEDSPTHADPQALQVLQESGVTMAFVNEALPRLEKDGIDLDVYYVANSELFTALPRAEQERILPEARTKEAMGITGFTMVTMCRWVRSYRGRAATLFPYQHGHFLGSRQGPVVLAEAGLDGESQYWAIRRYLDTK